MSLPYKIKSSLGKDEGAFATKDLTPGTLIMRDERTMETSTDRDILQAFRDFDSEDQTAFLQLHEGRDDYEHRIERIYGANCFRELNSETSYIYMLFSKVNHSCVPNAEFYARDGDSCLVALKPIPSGSEVFISYSHELLAKTRQERRDWLQGGFHFQCCCDCCIGDARSVALSDARRTLLSIVLPFAQAEQVDTTDEVVMHLLQAAYKNMRAGVLSRWQSRHSEHSYSAKSTFYFLLASLLEVEGISGLYLYTSYRFAGGLLLRQITTREDGIVLVGAVENAMAWVYKGLKIELTMHDHDAAMCKKKKQRSDGLLDVFEVHIVQDLQQAQPNFEAFALHFFFQDGLPTFRAITKVECEEILLQHQRRPLLKAMCAGALTMYKESSRLRKQLRLRQVLQSLD